MIFYVLEINECVSSPCINGGHCVDEENSYTCNCQTGYTGNHCQTGQSVTM